MIYFVRHGQTDWNLEGKYQGQTDIELNQTGINQALELKEKLKSYNFDVVIASPLKRAHRTAEIITDKEIITDDRIMERHNGQMEGVIKNTIFVDFADPNETRFNIEPLSDFRERIYSFWSDIETNYKNKDVLVVSHGGVGIYTQCYFKGEPENNDYQSYKIKNCEVLKI